ncbi:alpha/beta fold hydrolase [Actinocorallia populi]|uniref:alpha/beta fold hydrolase n=1 Tax=Actinocorallia populi TaxID=2079200 RepID=UPI000D0867B6|nr:alpha/beta fold hydrolase [Actinocorallia populi]
MSTPRFLELPPAVRRATVRTPRGSFAVLEALPVGEPERQPALLVPGFTGSKEDFLGVLQTLTGAGRRVLALDMRGQHDSPGCTEPSRYLLPELGADVAEIVASLGSEPVHLVGHSFGGLVTRETVLAEPSLIASYTLMSSGPCAITGPSAAKAAALRDALTGALSMEQIWQIKLGPDARAAGWAEEIIDFLRLRCLNNCTTGLVAMAGELLTAPDRTAELAKVADDTDLPLMVLYGEDDDAWLPGTQAAMSAHLDAARVVIPGAAHSPAWEAPETTAHALTGFWNSAERR